MSSFGGRDELASATGIAVHDAIVYACDYQLDRVVRYDAATGASLGILVELDQPISLDIGPDGELYVLDAGGVQRIDPETGAHRGRLVDTSALEYPRSFTFI